jgi:vacuolar-type H+-ATPase subunit H
VPHMPDFLSRFRPAGAPGAGRAAVPADRQRDRESELGPVLAALDEPNAECAELVAAARRDAEQIITAARSQADDIVVAARRRAAGLVDELVQQAVSRAEAAAASIRAEGAAEAAAVAERARQRLPALVGRAVALVRELGDEGRPA